jgi:hypothetical protein
MPSFMAIPFLYPVLAYIGVSSFLLVIMYDYGQRTIDSFKTNYLERSNQPTQEETISLQEQRSTRASENAALQPRHCDLLTL